MIIFDLSFACHFNEFIIFLSLPFAFKPILSSTMILTGYFTALVSIPIMFANAVSIPRANVGECYTIVSGYLSASIGTLSFPLDCIKIDLVFKDNSGELKAFDLNSKEELAYNNGSAVQAAFQVSARPYNENEQEFKPLSLGMP